MVEVASRELRNRTRALLDRVEAGEIITITVDGRPVAVLAPIGRRSRWMGRGEFAARILRRQADPDLAGDLASLVDEATDGVPLQ